MPERLIEQNMKVLLINPPFTQYGSEVEIQADEPLGLMYLAAYLRQKGIQVEILDAFQGKKSVPIENDFYKSGLSNEEIITKITEYEPDIVGISTMFTMHSKGVHDLAAVVKRISQNILVVCGGSHASALPDLVLRDENVDIVVIGEGEETLLELVDCQTDNKQISDVPGTAVRENGKVKINPVRPHIENIDELPFPARDMVDMNIYLGDRYRNDFSMSPPRANIITSRGCPYKCPYCAIHSIWRHTWRGTSATKIADEIELLIDNYQVNEIAFQDDNLTLNKKRINDLCDEILKRKLRIKWCTPNGVAIWTLDKELIAKMKTSGCYKLTFGIETASLNTQKFINKSHVDLIKAKDIIKHCNKVGMWTHSAFIIGFPYETYEDIKATMDYAIDSDLDFAAFFIATPFPGTELYDIYLREGLLNLELDNPTEIKWTGCQQEPMCSSKYFNREELDSFLKDAHRQFYRSRITKFMNPIRLFKKLSGPPEVRFFLKLVKMYRSTVGNLTN
jgi:magnesium-protoporphyrin IX monomethyl ester (oxidative) cyclase